MADYVSTLTGPQMDAALLDMAEHNSEAYAVGERNGIAVASDDVTYHNNARYYAQIASSQIVGDASSAVRWDTDQSEVLTDAQKAQARENINAASDSDVVKITSQTLTSAEQAQARANIMAGGSNRNLLDNPWFTVNQKGFTSITITGSGTNIFDRWMASRSTVTLNDDGTLTVIPSQYTYGLIQRIERSRLVLGATYTASAKINGEIYSVTFVWDGTIKNMSYSEGARRGVYLGPESNFVAVWFFGDASDTMTFTATKLEKGTVSTLANDAPPDYGEELAKCQYYCRVLDGSSYTAVGLAYSATLIRFPLPFLMRAQPSIAVGGAVYATGTGGTLTVSSTTVGGRNSNSVELSCSVSGATTNTPYMLWLNAGAKIILSADL